MSDSNRQWESDGQNSQLHYGETDGILMILLFTLPIIIIVSCTLDAWYKLNHVK